MAHQQGHDITQYSLCELALDYSSAVCVILEYLYDGLLDINNRHALYKITVQRQDILMVRKDIWVHLGVTW